MSLKKEISTVLKNLADIYEFQGENRFKVNAFRNGARSITRVEGDLEKLIRSGEIASVRGIGKGILSVIEEYYEKNFSSEYENLLAVIPEGIVELFQIRGIGPKKVRVLYEKLDVKTIDSLEKACRENLLENLPGFGSKTQENILIEINRINRAKGLMLLHKAEVTAANALDLFESFNSVVKSQVTGDLRRGMEIIAKIELLVLCSDKNLFLEEISNSFNYNLLEQSSSTEYYKIEREYSQSFYVYLTQEPSAYERILFESTGSEEFLQMIEYSTSEECDTEEALLSAHGISFQSPELREVEALDAPENLVRDSDLSFEGINGLLHFHTTASDGHNSLGEMVTEGMKFGFNYFAVCDHSKSAFYANGLSEERILLQKKELRKFAKKKNLALFQGIESDILNDGSLDYSNEFLAELDFVVASIHSNFTLSEDEMTARIIKAIENENTDVFAHPTGRLLLSRDSYKLNIRKVLDACSRNDVAIEINANPHRLDLDWREIFYAREQGCKFAINADAHSLDGIEYTKYGIMIARKGALQKEEVINYYDVEQFKNFLNRKIVRKFN